MSLRLKNLFRRKKEFKGWNYYLNRHPAMVFFYSFLSFLLGIVILITTLHIGSQFIMRNPFISHKIPVIFSIENKDLLSNSDYMVDELKGELTIVDPDTSFTLLLFFSRLLTNISAIWFLFLFRSIIFSVIDDKPFIRNNVVRLRIIGILLLVVPGIHDILIQSLSLSVAAEPIIEGFLTESVLFEIPITNPVLLSGIFILILSEVFRSGVKLREEQDLTV